MAMTSAASAAARPDPTRLNVFLLACCQALSMTGMSLVITVSALVGSLLAPDRAYATLPVAVQMTATMLTTIPASLLMKQIGRRPAFMLGVLIGMAGASLCATAIFSGDFVLFCAGQAMMGSAQGFAMYYRFAAADTASPTFRPKAISLVMAGGVVSGLLGPQIATWTRDLFAPVQFAGSFAAIAVLWTVPLLLLAFVRIPRPSEAERRDSGRPFAFILAQPKLWVAMGGAVIAYSVMNFLMTSTPLAMVACGHSFADAALTIQGHVLGMFVPAFFTGSLIQRFGVMRVMAAGAVLMLGCALVNLTGLDRWQFQLSLLLLGVGWNFLFVGGTTLLGECHSPAEKAKVQAMNDFVVFSTVAVTAFSSGWLHEHLGWAAMNIATIPFLLVALALIAMQAVRKPRAA